MINIVLQKSLLLKVSLWRLLNALPICRQHPFYLLLPLFLAAVLVSIESLRLPPRLLPLMRMRIVVTPVRAVKVTLVLNPVMAVAIVILVQAMILMVIIALKLMHLLFVLDLLSPSLPNLLMLLPLFPIRVFYFYF